MIREFDTTQTFGEGEDLNDLTAIGSFEFDDEGSTMVWMEITCGGQNVTRLIRIHASDDYRELQKDLEEQAQNFGAELEKKKEKVA